MLKNALKTFRGGIHPPGEKQRTEKKPLEVMPPPDRVVVPLRQHTGAPARATVKVGDHVRVGDVIGKGPGFVTTVMHASISGEIVSILPRPHPVFRSCESVEIKADGKDEWALGTACSRGQAELLAPEEIKKTVTESGIVGLGGAAFPTHVKLSPPPEKKINLYILNGAECEPFLTADDRIMQERTDDIVLGLRLMMRAIGVHRAIIGVEVNKPDSIARMKEAVANMGNIEVVRLRTKYPQGSEKQLIHVLTGRQIPRGGLPMDVGVAINNVGTALAVTEAVCDGKPLVERAVTVTGTAIAEPKNLKIRIGTAFKDVVDYCGGFTVAPAKVLMGGPMMGIAQYTLDVPVIKGTSGIVGLAPQNVAMVESHTCIRCGRCVNACPMYLVPSALGILCERHKFEEARENGLMDCVECGCCTYICPAGRPMVHMFKFGKMELFKIAQKKRAEKEGK